MPCTTTIIVPPRQIALLAAMFCTLLGSLAAAGCEKRESVAVQIDVAKTVDVSNRARSPEAGTRVAASGFTVAAGMDDALRRAINTDEFRALALSKRLSKQDDPGQAKLLDAVAGMCAVSVRGSPAAVRVSVAGSDTKEGAAIANIIGRALSEAAMVNAAADLATRREIEYQALTRLETVVKELERAILSIDTNSEPVEASDATAARTSGDQAEAWVRHEVWTRELGLARADVDRAKSRVRVFEDLVATVVACPFWIVPASAGRETDWITLDRLDAGVVVFAVVDPASGRDWLSGALSRTDKTLVAAAGNADVAATKWRIGFDQKVGVSTVSFPSGADTAAAADLEQRVRATSVGDGTVITLGLTGDVSSKDRRAILDALTLCIVDKRRADRSMDAVNKLDPIDRRITIFVTELRERKRAFLDLASRSGATGETIASLYERSREGQEVERVEQLLATLRTQREMIDRGSNSIFDDLILIRKVEAPH